MQKKQKKWGGINIVYKIESILKWRKLTESQIDLLKILTQIDKPLARLIKNKGENTND